MIVVNNKTYREAQKRGFRGNYSEFATAMNKFNSEHVKIDPALTKEAYFGDTGINTPTIPQTMPPLAKNEQTASAPTPTNTAASTGTIGATGAAADNKIWGLNKWMFFGLVFLGLAAVGTGIFFWFRSKETMPALKKEKE